MDLSPFTPGGTVSRTVSGSTANVALSTTAAEQTVMVSSPAGNSLAFIKFGDSTVTAELTDTPILPGAVYVFTLGFNVTHVAAIGTAGTLYFTAGHGA